MMPNLSNLLGDVYDSDDDPSRRRPETDEHTPGEPGEPGEPPETAPGEQRGGEPVTASDQADSTAADDGAAGPDWASDDRLDAAFGDWTAGELPGTAPDEREQLEHLGGAGETGDAQPPADDAPASDPEPGLWPASQVRAVAAGELERPPATEPGPARSDLAMSDFTSVAQPPEPQPSEHHTPESLTSAGDAPPMTLWHRGDDDILPGGGRRGLGRLLGR